MDGKYATAAMPAPERTDAERLSDQLNELHMRLCGMVGDLRQKTDKLYGEPRQDAEKTAGGIRQVPAGLVGSISERVDCLFETADQMQAQVNRLNRLI